MNQKLTMEIAAAAGEIAEKVLAQRIEQFARNYRPEGAQGDAFDFDRQLHEIVIGAIRFAQLPFVHELTLYRDNALTLGERA